MELNEKIREIIAAYPFYGEHKKTAAINDGHINRTFVLDFDNAGKTEQFLVQQINTYVFKDPVGLMENFVGVTDYLRRIIREEGGDPEREALHVYFSNEGKPYFVDSEGKYWRVVNFITDSYTLQAVENADDFYRSAKAFGKFQCLLADYPINTLNETIPNFHNTVSRIADFKKALADDLSGRAESAEAEAQFVLDREKDCGILVDLLNGGELPLRVTHNDTKLNNVMFDRKTNEGICVVDLDTVMPGLSLYDFGDAIRFGANTAAEDEKDVSKVSLSLEYFAAYVKGYLSEAGKSLTEKEIEYLPFSAKLMTLECGMRFLGDYFNGDVYFKTDYPEHNLVRSRTQFALVADIEKKYDEMCRIVEDCKKELGL